MTGIVMKFYTSQRGTHCDWLLKGFWTTGGGKKKTHTHTHTHTHTQTHIHELQTISEENTSCQQNGEVKYTVEDTLPSNLLEFICRNPWRRHR